MRIIIVLLLLLAVACYRGDSAIFMLVEYATNGTVVYQTNIANATMMIVQTVELDVTVIGCDVGYYDVYRTLPFVCSECTCDAFTDGRVELY